MAWESCHRGSAQARAFKRSHWSTDRTLHRLWWRAVLEQEIPAELYTAVAVILSWVYWLRGMQPGDEQRQPAAG
jgi:type III secretion system FlhB-like substrate exporter